MERHSWGRVEIRCEKRMSGMEEPNGSKRKQMDKLRHQEKKGKLGEMSE